MKHLRRFVWHIASRLLIITLVLGLLITGFYYAMNMTNIYIVLKDGMARRAQVVMMTEDVEELRKYFYDSFLSRDGVSGGVIPFNRTILTICPNVKISNAQDRYISGQIFIQVDHSITRFALQTLHPRIGGSSLAKERMIGTGNNLTPQIGHRYISDSGQRIRPGFKNGLQFVCYRWIS